ncbi:Cobalamin biosynthesis protein CbiD-like protein [Methanocorpusculum labreanum Z]|uniref:Cobalamin biosynthesis protein CbiD-like protein n=1 Tax=Methanocorpusculum labreanum (strain ATCC 43576 / DSM 4855 / Z) TaxID=410358 RepID=A2SSE5_METLZ|nr:cobalt-precorrin-5B (C(1))-methyltransferase [Methanocorpusculum labreanum]ABN07251.1 Cobalamin biosynthesis protein CbiD-like protein [Methanocorpusculum labreanum Z]
MIDPVTGFAYPESWTAKCRDAEALAAAKSGFGVLTSTGSVLRRGFTTGSTAAAACYAAVASLSVPVDTAPILLPCGILAVIPAVGKNGEGYSKKYSGDYPNDITAGILICAKATPSDEISLETGEGVGRFVRDTPRYSKGTAAVSPPAKKEILTAISSACRVAGISGAAVLLTIPDGRRIGALTLNPKVGIEGGISVVGTTGFVEPWDDHLSETVSERIAGAKNVVITTGRIGLRYSRLLFPEYEVVLAGSKISEALEAAKLCENAVICGLPGLILRFFHPDVATSRGFPTVEELIAGPEGKSVLAEELNAVKQKYPWLRIVIINRDGQVIGDTE